MKCSVINCHNNTKFRRGKSFFRFPKDADLRKKWLEAIGRPEFLPNPANKICDDHFLCTDIEHFMTKRILKPDVVPFLNIDEIDDRNCVNGEHDVTNKCVSPGHYSAKQIDEHLTPSNTAVNNSHAYMEVECAGINENVTSKINVQNQQVQNLPVAYSIHYIEEFDEVFEANGLCSTCCVPVNEMEIEPNDNIMEDVKIVHEESSSLSVEVFRMKTKLRKLRKCIRNRNKTVKRLRQTLIRQKKNTSEIRNLLEELLIEKALTEDNYDYIF